MTKNFENDEIKQIEEHGIKNIKYMMKMLWRADKGTVIYTLYKNIGEEIFYVFFFVYMTQYIYTCIEQKTPFNQLLRFIIVLCICHVVIHIVSAGHSYYMKLHMPLVYKSIYGQVIDKSIQIEYKKFEEPEFYDKFTRALDECVSRSIQTLYSISFLTGNFISSIMASVVVARVDWRLLLFVIPAIAASMYFGSKTSKAYFDMDMKNTRNMRTAAYTKRVFYEKKYAAEIRLFGIKNVLLSRHCKAYDDLYKTTREYRIKIAQYDALRWLIFCAVSLSLPMIFVAFIVKGNPGIVVAPYIAMVSALEFVSGGISVTIDRSIEVMKHSKYITNIKSFLEYEPKTRVNCVSADERLSEIEFKNVSFTYEGALKPTIVNMNLHIHSGEKIAFVGHNGAGKTTLVKLIMGLYDVTDGEILVGGKNVSDYEAKSYHSHFGTVFQDLQIFALPISENVLMRKPQNDEERKIVEEAIEKAQLGEKLKSLPNGIDTMVTKEFDDNGIVFSGGESQKLAIARVFAKNPDIVILDEPSSALDPIAEYNMYNNMLEASEGKTVIFISHRLSSARVADKIYMLENGEIIESGSHDELMKMNGSYAKMFEIQAKNYKKCIQEAEVI